jgi:hypothetical protein
LSRAIWTGMRMSAARSGIMRRWRICSPRCDGLICCVTKVRHQSWLKSRLRTEGTPKPHRVLLIIGDRPFRVSGG